MRDLNTEHKVLKEINRTLNKWTDITGLDQKTQYC